MSGMYDFAVAAGGSQRFSVVGNKAKIVVTSSALPLTMRLDGGDGYSCLEGQGARLPDGKQFSDVTLFNKSAVALTGFVFIGDAEFDDTRVTGNVRVIDSSADKTLAGNQFLQTCGLVATAGFGSIVVLTPNNGVKRLVIKGLAVQSAVAGPVLIGSGSGGGTAAAYAAGALNTKLIGGALSQSRQGAGTIVAGSPAAGEITGVQSMCNVYVPANAVTPVPMTTPIILSGTQVLWAASGVLNRDLSIVVDCEET